MKCDHHHEPLCDYHREKFCKHCYPFHPSVSFFARLAIFLAIFWLIKAALNGITEPAGISQAEPLEVILPPAPPKIKDWTAADRISAMDQERISYAAGVTASR